jgi:indolepyruvate ferredoxin oxidoreductase beta subunit
VLALNPAIGEVEVAPRPSPEAGRMIQRLSRPTARSDAPTHRVLAIGERMAMGDGSLMSRSAARGQGAQQGTDPFDMDQAAENGRRHQCRAAGRLAGSGRPLPDTPSRPRSAMAERLSTPTSQLLPSAAAA